ncbi:MAG: NADP-dependent oxidoreductase [Gordonia sp. (in: high G+C Gram-positive bacteria)]
MDTALAWTAGGTDGLDDFRLAPRDVRTPASGEVTIRITAAGVNPVDLKQLRRVTDPGLLPLPIGFEIAGVVSAVGPGAGIASGPVEVGDRVAAFRVRGGYAEALTVPSRDVFALADSVDDDAGAGLLLAGCTAADLLERSGAQPGDTILMHAASGAVGILVVQLATMRGIRVIGTCSPAREAEVKRFGGVPIPYGSGVVARVRALAPDGVVAALDAAGTDDAVAASLELVPDRSRIITVAAQAAAEHGFIALSGAQPQSAAFRDSVRGELLALLAAGQLQVPIARTYPLSEAREALALVASGKAGGKVVLHP